MVLYDKCALYNCDERILTKTEFRSHFSMRFLSCIEMGNEANGTLPAKCEKRVRDIRSSDFGTSFKHLDKEDEGQMDGQCRQEQVPIALNC